MPGPFDVVLDEEESRLRSDNATETSSYDDVLNAEADQRSSELGAALRQAAAINPDKAAQQQTLSEQTGIPREVVERNEPVVAQQARVRQLIELSRASPILAEQLADPEFAKIAHDDAETLAHVEHLTSMEAANQVITKGVWSALDYAVKGGRALGASLPRINASLWGIAEAGAEVTSKYITGPLAGTILPQDPAAIAAGKFRAYRRDQDAFATDIRRDENKKNFLEQSILSGIESLGQNLLLMPAAIATGNPELALVPMSAQTGGQAYGQARDANVPVLQALQFAMSQATIEYATEKLPMSKLIGDLKAGTPFWRSVLHQAATEIPGEQLATVLQDLNEWSTLRPEAPFSAYLAERPSAAAQTLIATVVSVGGQTTVAHGLNLAIGAMAPDMERANEAQRTQVIWQQMQALAAASKLRERAPDTFAQFVQRAAEAGPVTDVYVPGRELATVLEQAPNVQVPQSVQEQLAEAVATGGDVRIPVGEFAAYFAASDATQALLPLLKSSPEAMNFNDAQTYYQEQVAAFKQQADQILTTEQSNLDYQNQAEQVRAHFSQQLEAAQRFTPDVNNAYAALMRDFYTVTAQRLGITPVEMLQRYPLRIAAENVAQATMDQGELANKTVYHATNQAFAGYKAVDGIAGWFSDQEFANNFALAKFGYWKTAHLGWEGQSMLPNGVNIRPAHLALKNPFDAKFLGSLAADMNDEGAAKLAEQLGMPVEDLRKAAAARTATRGRKGRTFDLIANPAVTATLAAKGFDGIAAIEDGHEVYAAFDPSQIKSAITLEQSSIDRLKEIAGFARIEKHLKPEERAKLRKDTATRLLGLLRDMPSAKEVAAVALAGSAKRGWYQHGAEAMVQVFGADAPRFAALLAAMSPQTSVESNLFNALSTWGNWVKADRPTNRDKIVEIMGQSVEGNKGVGSVLYAWVPNSVRALTAEDPSRLVLSGPKVNSFFLNLVGVTDEVTNDSWMASYAAVDQTLFAGRLNVAGTDPGKTPGYLAMSVRTRQAAAALTKLTGEEWTPAEVQETVWSWAKTVLELAASGAETRSAVELLKDGAITDELISSTPDFRSLFTVPKYSKILEKAGYGDQVRNLQSAGAVDAGAGNQEPAAGGEAGAPAAAAPSKHLLAAARRLDTLRRERREGAADAGTAARAKAEARGVQQRDGVRGSPGPLAGKPGQDPLVRPVDGLPAEIAVPGRGTVRFGPFRTARLAAQQYMERTGLRYAPAAKYGKIDPKRGSRIAKAFDEMKHAPNDPEVREAYTAMINETIEQWREIEKTGLKVEFITGDDPYAKSPRHAILDVVENNHLWVFPTDAGFGGSESAHVDVSGNPLMERTDVYIDGRRLRANDVFRIVHDYMGHIKEGFGFRAEGEDNAWQSHAAMYTPLARRAMTVETRGQNSWVNFGPFAKKNRTASAADTQYAPQKIGLLPEWVSSEGMLAGADSGMGVFEQSDQQARGNITFGPDIKLGATITLLKNADLSTALHEFGHFYLEVLFDIAAQNGAPAGTVADALTVLKWFGVKDLPTWKAMTIAEKRESHEKFARGFEAYLFEGKSPNAEFTSLFARFRAWLINVYKSLSALNVELTSEVRGVFDRMLAAEQSIKTAEQMRAMSPLFASAAEAGATPEEWQAYLALGADATSDAVRALERRSLADLKWANNARDRYIRKLQKEADAKRAAIREEVAAEVAKEPIYQAMGFLRKGTKLSLPVLKEMYGEAPNAPWRYFATGEHGLAATEGVHPDAVAQQFGFSSGDELVRKLLAADPVKEVVDGLTDQRMLERHGDLIDDTSITRAAEKAVHNDARARFVATELDFLGRAANARLPTGADKRGRPTSVNLIAKAAKQFAEQLIARKKVRDIRPHQYLAAEARAAKAAIAAKNPLEKAAEKRNQLVNLHAARIAQAATTEVEKAVRYLRKFDGNVESIDGEYLDQIHQLLERFDLRTVSRKEVDKRASLAQWVEEQRSLGFEPQIDKALLAEAQRQHYGTLSLEEFRGLVDAVKNIEHLGRLKTKLLTAKDERELAERVSEASAVIRDNAKGTVPERKSSDRGPLVGLGRMFRGFVAEHRKFASLIREMGGFKEGGPLWELFSRTMNEAGDKEASMREAATEKLSELFKPILAGSKLAQKTFVPEVNASFTREERIGIALNTGNEINLERVLTGQRWSPTQMNAVMDTLTREEWNFVQSVWDYLESFRPEIAAKSKRVTGVEPEWVGARQVQTKFGTYKGGYYPIKYDPLLDSRSEADSEADVLKQMTRGLYVNATTRRGHLQARTESTGRRLRFDFGVIFQHVDQVIHDLSWHEYLIDANRLLRAKPIDAAIREHYGPEKLAQLKDALRDIAIGHLPMQSALERAVAHIRTGATIVGLGWNVVTSLVQPLGLTQSMVRIGPKWVAIGFDKWLGDETRMENGVKQVYEKSEFMRLRGKTMQREINEIRNKVAGRSSAIEASFFWFIQKMQIVADMPTWHGAYEKAWHEGADMMTEEKAVALADQAVRDAQGSGHIGDLAAIQRGGEFKKLWTNFYSFWNTTYNLAVEQAKIRKLSPAGVAQLAGDYLLLFIVPSVMSSVLKSILGGDDEDKTVARIIRDQINYFLGTMVGLREMGAAVQGFQGYSGPAGTRFFSDVAKLVKQAEQGDLDEAALKAAAGVAGILFHLPLGQVARSLDGIHAMVTGKTPNPGALLVGSNKN